MSEKPNPEDFFKEDPLESLLDAESEEEFGLPEFKEHLADTLTPAVLKDWTAADFASIYVRFRPHLERHAKRFLVNRSQVEEVVQDAFLYLMTTLPELDSELGVLRFMKWKVRLLALDVIRANSRATFAPIDEQPEFAAKGPELNEALEHADDAAIVSLALAKLQPRHREALIATLYEEKSTEVVAAQMGLSENAFRQLLFRARAAFKKALVGEAEIQGKSISQILSIAARKAAAESGKYISAAGAFLLVLAIAIGVVPNLSNNVTENIALPEPTSSASQSPVEVTTEPAPEAQQVEASLEAQPAGEEAVNSAAAPMAQVAQASTVTPAPTAPASAPEESERDLLEGFLREALDDTAFTQLSRNSTGKVISDNSGTNGTLTVTNDSGLVANVAYDLATETGIQYTWFNMTIDGNDFAAVPKVALAEKILQADGTIKLRYLATDLLIGDVTGNYDYIAVDDSKVSLGALRLELILDSKGKVLSSVLTLTQKS
jgi:RNA polymerase sigma-70 factor (ECF subfamily)